ncbi:DUF1652 domain-containing protein [Phytopseudomonas dryadis]|uniref:DUF1652 domain-containing protein n=1 Tax=Phytopseudomonas dryadis TaxID=2487520 RepID=A0A4Q9RA39_9GAMM|nr:MULTISPECIES: DUF1652 domain-containing protein [Pseudomonas]TBU97561.1 hypothetical protein DNK44_00825 [Pseudomonas dryadis]TBV10016.1 hypothetical protein DNK34_00835 [Pseudomonas dryadis]TBV19155.1 hypothetical protein DNK41_05410 [Pseudomonas sp. FRB 230]
MMSVLEQRRIVECAFLPLVCHCTIDSSESVTIQVRDPVTAQVYLNVTGISRSELSSSRQISALVLQLRQDLRTLNSGSDLHKLG